MFKDNVPFTNQQTRSGKPVTAEQQPYAPRMSQSERYCCVMCGRQPSCYPFRQLKKIKISSRKKILDIGVM
ncbi:hypothetical protein J6590_056622, partial [Homalodisca vitripennis]